ncbi:MAG: O-antigen ligase family protein, partial [Pirellula sp.]
MPRRLGLLGLIVVGAYCFASAPSGVRVRNLAILVSAAGLLGWATLSLTWSIDTSETTRELIRVAVYTAVAVAMARRFPAKEICLILIFSFLTSILVASVMDVVVGNFRPWQSQHRLQGSLHPNDLGRQALLVAVAAYAFMSVKSERTVWLIICGLAIVILVLTKSRTSFISLFAGLLMVSMIRVRGYQAVAWLTTLLIIVSFAGLSWQLLSSEIRSSIAGGATLGRKDKATALTGRFPLWEQALQQADNDLTRGSGFGAFWNNDRTKIMGEELEWFPRHAHSVYIEMIVNLGYIGLGILLVLVLSMLATSVFSSRQTGQVHFTVCAAIIVSEMVYG